MLSTIPVVLREATANDSAQLLVLLDKLYAETTFLLFEPGELAITEEQYARRIEETARTEAGVMFVGEAGDELIGVVYGNRGGARRTRHSLYLVIGVLRSWAGRGVGHALLQKLDAWARAKELHRLELTVAVNNQRAIALYEKCGFEREGIKRHSRKIDGRYSDELYMSKLLAT